MDFDTLIGFLFFILFFILPSIFKQIKAKKQTTAQNRRPEKPSFFAKINDQIQQFVRDIEQQAKQQKEEQQQEQNFWDELAEEPEPDYFDNNGLKLEPDVGSRIKKDQPKRQPDSALTRSPAQRRAQRPAQDSSQKSEPVFSEDHFKIEEPMAFVLPDFRKKKVQNAIVWSEILSKPLALRQEERF